ncbi:hypothetical protein BSKO_01530 [Bryopsis sp. KO-2023]|nr:hypothetical protein BSKO_01530 [Bryopsis sp. KO-2023]
MFDCSVPQRNTPQKPQREWSNARAPKSRSASHLSTPRRFDDGDARLQVLHLENQAIKAVKAREDCLERLFICAEKVDDTTKSSGGWLSKNDPIVRLFYRLVSTLRDKTIVAVETISAFQRLTSATSPFAFKYVTIDRGNDLVYTSLRCLCTSKHPFSNIYRGVNYLRKMGPDLAFLDEVEFVRRRLREQSVVKDPFLRLLTPNGIPFDEITVADLQRGGRVNTVALRIRMAAKVMEHDAQHNPVEDVDIYSSYQYSTGEGPLRSKSARINKVPGQSLYTIVDSAARTIQSVFRGFIKRRSAKATRGAYVEVQQGVEESSLRDQLGRWSETNSENDEVDAVLDAVLESLEPPYVDAFPPGAFTVEQWQCQRPLALTAPQTARRRPGKESTEEDEVDYIVDAMIDSLEGPYENHYMKGTFTVAGWELDRHFM